MGLSEDLHGLVENAPPPAFELDQLMQGRRNRWIASPAVLGMAAFAAVALVVGGGYLLSSGSRPDQHPTQVGASRAQASPTPTPTTDFHDATAARLTNVLAHLPADVRTALHMPATAKFVYFQVNNSPAQWTAQWSYQGVLYNILLMEGAQPDPTVNGCGPEAGPQGNCQQEVADGGVMINLAQPKGATKFRTMNASFARNDGTSVEVWASVPTGKQILPGSLMTWLDKAARAPGFTLNP